ncbi:hypothetical protein [Pseudomonas sp. CFT9]|uniref:AbiTii domain-containing protein n=1 Tax=Pseudomonas sp. CFT9 TaxID=911244 RepID=UPI000A652883|nr:hypothetical protein [Pseudomonas sp. CFT9]
MSKHGVLKEALELSEALLSEIEMSSTALSTVALKASRLARMVGQVDHQQIMIYEAAGYPSSPKGLSAEVWRLAVISGRTYSKKVGEEIKSYAHTDPIEQAEAMINSAKSISPNALPWERTKNSEVIKDKSKFVASRRAYIYNFVSSVYHELRFSSVASDVFERTRVRVDGTISEVIPDAVKRFSAVYDNLLSENDEDWSNAVHSCRRILQDAADALYPAREDKIINPGPKQKSISLGPDNYINRLIAYVEENASSERFSEIVGSHMSYLGERLDSIFRAAQKGSHHVIASQDEADRYVIYTYLVIGDILQLRSETAQKALSE